MLMSRKISKQRGISVLEVMLSFSLIAVVLVMATRYFRPASIAGQVSNALSVLHGYVAAETSYATANNNGYAATVGPLVSGGYLPANLQKDPWGNAVELSASAGTSFTITFTSVPLIVCQNLGTLLTNEGAAVASGNCAADPGALTVTFN